MSLAYQNFVTSKTVKSKATVVVYGVCLYPSCTFWLRDAESFIHISVGFCVVRSDWLDDTKSLINGISDRYRFPRFLSYMVLLLLKTADYGDLYAENIICMRFFTKLLKTALYSGLFVIMLSSCCSRPVNAINHESFNGDGECIDTLGHLEMKRPSSLKLFVETSGSMNGFFRSNQPTEFKEDIWSIFSDFDSIVDNVYVFEQQNRLPKAFGLQTFKSDMSRGSFVSSVSTEVPQMLQQVLQSTDIENGEAAVLVSDMKYDPVGNKAINVLLSLYATDVRNVMMKTDASVILIAATSSYIDKRGQIACEKSPYYYLIVGNSSHAGWLRNCIATILKDNGRYVDAIEFGMDYKSPSFTLEDVDNGSLLEKQPTIYAFSPNDTCRFTMVVDLSAYPWNLADDGLLKNSIVMETTKGSTVEVDTVIYHINNHADKMLKRIVTADIHMKVYDVFSKADVLEWYIKIPETELNSQFIGFFGAQSVNQLDKSYSIESFIQGCFRGKNNHCSEIPNRILLSTIKK